MTDWIWWKVYLSDVRLCAPIVRRYRGHHAFYMHSGVRRAPVFTINHSYYGNEHLIRPLYDWLLDKLFPPPRPHQVCNIVLGTVLINILKVRNGKIEFGIYPNIETKVVAACKRRTGGEVVHNSARTWLNLFVIGSRLGRSSHAHYCRN